VYRFTYLTHGVTVCVMANYKWINRKSFTEKRYKNYLEKREFFGGAIGKTVILTDLTTIEPATGIPMKELVICDMCNENIFEDPFIMVENSLCYHRVCSSELPILQPKKQGLRLVSS
jgi:hypothetical protein